MSLLLKKCTAMYTTILLSLIAQHMLLKRGVGERHWIVDYINGIMYSFTLIMHLSSLSTDGRKRGRKGQQRTDNIEKIHPLEFEHPLLWNQCYVTLSKRGRKKKSERWKQLCSRTGMNVVSAEPNVRPIKVYWDQVVLVSLKVDIDLINREWG